MINIAWDKCIIWHKYIFILINDHNKRNTFIFELDKNKVSDWVIFVVMVMS